MSVIPPRLCQHVYPLIHFPPEDGVLCMSYRGYGQPGQSYLVFGLAQRLLDQLLGASSKGREGRTAAKLVPRMSAYTSRKIVGCRKRMDSDVREVLSEILKGVHDDGGSDEGK